MTNFNSHQSDEPGTYSSFGPHSSNLEPRRISSRARNIARGIGALAGIAAISVAGVFGVKAIEAHEKAERAQYEAVQHRIGPIIDKAMVNVDNQTLAQHKAHPNDVLQTPAGYGNAVEFVNGNVDVVMGTTDGKPDPNKPLYVSYNNNSGTGEHTIGINVTMNSPEGNHWVDHYGSGYLGTTQGGWGATVPGMYDTTSQGPMDGGPPPVPSARQVAQTVRDFGPYQPYS